MSNFKGTKGKWSVYNNATTRKGKLGIVMSWDEKGQNPVEIASVFTSKAKSNAQLIACAPEMLEMLEDIANGNSPDLKEIKQLIKKTTEI